MEETLTMKIGAKMKANKIQQMGFNSVFHLLVVLLVANALFFIVSPSAEASPPEIVRVFPANNATNVPTGVYLELEFSESVDPALVMAETLTLKNLTSGDTLDLDLDSAVADNLIQVSWYKSNTLLRMVSKDNNGDGSADFSLTAGHQYKVQIAGST